MLHRLQLKQMSNKSAIIDNTVTVAAGMKLVRTTAPNLSTTVSDLSLVFCIDDPRFIVIMIDQHAMSVTLNMATLLIEQIIEKGTDMELPRGIHREFAMFLDDNTGTRTTGSTQMKNVTKTAINISNVVKPYL